MEEPGEGGEDLESSEKDDDEGAEGEGGEFVRYESINSDEEDPDVIQVAKNLDTDMERLERAKEAEKQRKREAEKARRAKAARISVGFNEEEHDAFNETFNAGSGDVSLEVLSSNKGGAGSSTGNSRGSTAKDKRTLKRKQRGSTSSTGSMDKQLMPRRKTLRTSEIFPRHDWPLGMSEAQVNLFSRIKLIIYNFYFPPD